LADAFNPSSNEAVNVMAIQSDGKVVVGGDFTNIGGQTRRRIARLEPENGGADSFDPGANSTVKTIKIQTNGKILVGGAFNGTNSIGGADRNRLARLDPVTGLADLFDPNVSDTVETVSKPDTRHILVGGDFHFINGVNRNYLARIRVGNSGFDYDGDEQTDISIFRPSSGAWYLQQSTAGQFGTEFGYATDKISPADYDGD
jgi:hypothetical protein